MIDFDRIAEIDRHYRCFITLTPELVARGAGGDRRNGPTEPEQLAVAIKDCIDIGGVRGTWGSGVHRDRIAAADSFVVARLREAGVSIVGTTNLHEFAFGGTTLNPHYGACRNAWRDSMIAGGSSGGSAVAVALGLCDAALGTDTGASVRLPASLNGVLGLRPTHGAISASGVMPVSPPHDTVGLIARDVAVLRQLQAISYAVDPDDPFTRAVPAGTPMAAGTAAEVGALRLGVPTALLTGCDPAIAAAFAAACERLKRVGHAIVEVDAPAFVDVAAVLAGMIMADAAAFHRERLDQQADAIGAAIHQRIAPGRSMTAGDYVARLRWLEHFRGLVAATFARVDLLICPTVPVSPPAIADADNAVATTAALSRNCWLAPAARLPALSMPCGLDEAGVPIGFQLVGPRWSDGLLLTVAEVLADLLPPIGRPRDYRDPGGPSAPV